MSDLGARIIAGDQRAAARAMRNVDDRMPGYLELLKEIFPSTGRAFVVGVTGNPGAGKSTLTDRIRMTRHATDAGVFIRSVATRGHLGGLSRSARDMVRVLDAFGCDVVIVETVGVGQDVLEITRTAHST